MHALLTISFTFVGYENHVVPDGVPVVAVCCGLLFTAAHSRVHLKVETASKDELKRLALLVYHFPYRSGQLHSVGRHHFAGLLSK